MDVKYQRSGKESWVKKMRRYTPGTNRAESSARQGIKNSCYNCSLYVQKTTGIVEQVEE